MFYHQICQREFTAVRWIENVSCIMNIHVSEKLLILTFAVCLTENFHHLSCVDALSKGLILTF